MSTLDEIAGVGYAGYASVDGAYLLLLPSEPEDDINQGRSRGAVSTQVAAATGEIPVRNRPALKVTLSAQLTPATARLLTATTVEWRAAGLYGQAHHVVLSWANGRGYDIPEARINAAAVTLPEGGLGTVSFEVLAWRWTETPGAPTPRTQAAFDPFGDPDHQPIPAWACTADLDAMAGGTTTEFGLHLANGWTFRQLLEGTIGPPTPRLATPGPLLIGLDLTVLAPRDLRPADSGRATIVLGAADPGPAAVAARTIAIPFLYRDGPARAVGVGDGSKVVRQSARYMALGALPAIS